MLYAKRAMYGLIALVALALPAISFAQGPSQIVINYPEVTDTGDALQVGLYFTITDNTGRVVPNAKVQSARILLDDGERDDNAFVEQPTTPFFITLVLDASGSMGGSAESMRQAAIQAIRDAPDEAWFSVIRFNEDIDVLQEFTEDRNSAINAISDVRPVNESGTCLYDAAFRAIELMRDAPPGRRAIILFTDGQDTLITNQPCSSHVLRDVVDLATRNDSRVPIHTIGLSTQAQNINAGELRSIAADTGGVSAIGGQQDLESLFEQIMDALKSQWLAQSSFYPSAGPHAVTLTVTLDDGTMLTAATTIESPRDFPPPITPTATETPIVVDLEIAAVRSNSERELIELDVNVQGEKAIREYRFAFFDADSGFQITQQSLPAPLTPPIVFSATPFNGDIRVELRAIGQEGQFLSWPDDRGNPVDHVTYEFTYFRPTPTPIPATITEIPVNVDIIGISYDEAADVIRIEVALTGADRIRELEVYVTDSKTGLNVGSPLSFEPNAPVQLSGERLVGQTQYGVYIIARGANGENLDRSNQQEFVYTPPVTPTPTPTETPTPTPTEKPVIVGIGGISLNEDGTAFEFDIDTEDQDRIQRYELQLLDSDTRIEVDTYTLVPPPHDTISVPISDMVGGKYTAILHAYGPNGELVAESGQFNFAYTPVLTPTPTPTATPTATSTPTATPTPTPEPGMVERVTDTVRDNPALALVVGLIGVGLVLILIIILRPRRKQQTGTDFLSAQTGVYQVSRPEAGGAPMLGMYDEATNIAPMDPEKTDVYPGSMPPLAALQFIQYPDAARINQSEPIIEFPFTIGRGRSVQNHLSLDEDTSVSRRHATITYESGQFFLTDEGSSNGTALDGSRLMPDMPTPLQDGARIMLGKNTVVTFNMTSTSYPGGDRTMPGGMDDEDRTDYIVR